MNSIIKTAPSGNSPFDSIRRYNEKGVELWSGRELMEILGYKTWENFNKSVQRAIQSCKNTNNDELNHFRSVTKKSKGRDFQDFEISRHGCYLVAMNGDPEKIEIAQAQSYFATKTREAEVVIPKISEDLEMMRLQNENLKMQLDLQARQDARIGLHGLPVTLLLEGKADAIVRDEVKVTEVINLDTGTTQKFLSADQLKVEVQKRTGQKVKSLKSFTDEIRKAGRDDLLVAVTRQATSEYVTVDRLDEAIGIVYGRQRQKLIGE
jgi:BRO family, N-terminal domain